MSDPLPRGWRLVTLGDVAESWLGKMLDRQKHTTGAKLPYLRNQNVRWFRVDTSDVSEMFFESRELERYGLIAGDVLICEGGEPGRAAIWDGRNPNMKFQKAIHRVRPSRSLLPEWLVFRLFQDAESGKLESYFTGTTIKHFTGTALAKYELPLPPTGEQRRIVAKLEALQPRSRRAREALDAVPPLLEKLRQAILAAAFRGDLTKDWRAKQKNIEPATELLKRIRTERRQKWEATELAKLKSKGKLPTDDKWKAKYQEPDVADVTGLPDLPEGWCWASLETLTDAHRGIPYGIVLTGDPIVDGVPTVRCGDIKNFEIELSGLKRVQSKIAAEFDRTRLEGSEVLIAIRGTVGATAVATTDMIGMNISREVAMIPLLQGVVSRYLMFCLASPEAQSRVLKQVKGVAQGGINLADLRVLPVPLAPEREQQAVLTAVTAHWRTCSKLETSRRAAAVGVATLDQAILAKAFRGELVPQDPNDEPAEAMLARARSTTGAAPTNGTPSKRGRPRAAQRAQSSND